MTINLQTITVRHERRIRLVFTNTVDTAGFGIPAPAYYTVENLDGKGVSPEISAAMLVPNSPKVVDLALLDELVPGAMYKVIADGVPATDLSVTPAGSEQRFLFAAKRTIDHRETAVIDRERLLYGTDLVWNGSDFEETATGDLATIAGTPNVTKALWRGIEAEGLPWDDRWGGKVREYVDSPSSSGTTLKGAVVTHILRDPRVASVTSELEQKDAETFLHVTPSLKSGEKTAKVSVTVPNG